MCTNFCCDGFRVLGPARFPNFPNDYQFALIEELANAMGTWSGWPADGLTWPWAIADGINKVCRKYGYSNWASNKFFPSWNDAVNEINSGRAFTLAMLFGGTALQGDRAYGQHVVTCVG